MHRTLINHHYFYLLLLLVSFFILPQEVFASETGGDLPYESWLEDLRDSITGPFALGISVIGTVVSFIALIFGGDDMKSWVRVLLVIVLIAAMALGANDYIARYAGAGAEFSTNTIKNNV